jgi:hypothetical protein
MNEYHKQSGTKARNKGIYSIDYIPMKFQNRRNYGGIRTMVTFGGGREPGRGIKEPASELGMPYILI